MINNNIIRIICLIVEVSLARLVDFERAFVEAIIGQVGFTATVFLMVIIVAFTLGIFHKHEAANR